MIGETVSETFEILSSEHDVVGITQLIQGADTLVVVFVPFCFGQDSSESMESLVMDINDRLDEFHNHDTRVVCITREPPSTIRHWAADRGFQIDIFSDGTLEISKALVGLFDLAMFISATKDVHLGTFLVPMPGVVVIKSDGKISNKYVAPSPEAVQISVDDILKML